MSARLHRNERERRALAAKINGALMRAHVAWRRSFEREQRAREEDQEIRRKAYADSNAFMAKWL